MRKRMIQMLAAVFVFLAVVGFVKFQQIQAAIAGGKSYSPPPEAVTTIVARPQQWKATLEAVGSVAPVQGVTLSADQPGIVDRIAFDSGSRVAAGDVLVSLDTRQERAQLAAAEAQRDLANVNVNRAKRLLETQAIAQADYDQLAAQFKVADANANEMRATVERKTIRAPFSGIAGIRQVNVGQYLHSGDPVVPIQSLDPVYVNFALPQQDLSALRVGSTVGVSSSDSAASVRAKGRVTAVNPVVDESTRNVQVQATLQNEGGVLRPGMYVNVQVEVGQRMRVITLPASAINYAPYGNSVFLVENLPGPGGKTYRGVRQQFVQLGKSRGDQIAVLSGVHPGEQVVTSGVFKLRSGAAVMVNNSIQPGNNPAPRPEEN